MADDAPEKLAAPGDDMATMADRPVAKARVPTSLETPDTRVFRPGLRASLFPRQSLTGARSAVSTVSHAAVTMRDDEIRRTRMFSRVIIVIAAGCIATLPVLGGNPTAKSIFAIAVAAYVAVTARFVWQIRHDPDKFRDRYFLAPGMAGVCAGYAGVYFWGPFSPAPAVILMALYFNSLIGSLRYTLSVYLACAAAQATLSGLVIAGVVDDVGLITAPSLSLIEQLAGQGLVQLALLTTFLVGRLSRRSTIDSIERLENAVRDLAQRDALLNEARQELERAAWVGGPGRFTEQTLGSYKLGLIIGRGAMGEVYEGFHTETGEAAAVKLLHRNVLSDASQVVRFAREAEAVSQLDSAHVVRVFEVADPTSPIPYIAMERMVGDDLSSELRSRRTLPIDEVVDMALQVALGIDKAAAAGIVHRDLKPQNLFFHRGRDGSGQWKILDFGVSKLADGTGTLTQGRVVGTPTYMAPEQARGKTVDHRADVYALAAICYRALTGHPCFSGREVPQILYDVVHRMPIQPSRLAVDLPEPIDDVLAIGLAKNPGDRFESASELAAALRAASRGEVPAQLHKRARGLLDKRPWGSSDKK